MYTYIHRYISLTCTYVYMCVHTYIHIQGNPYSLVHMHIGTHKYTQAYTVTHIDNTYIQINTHKYIHKYTHRYTWCIHALTEVYTYTGTHTNTQAHTYIHTQVHMHTLFLCVRTHSCMCMHVKAIDQPWAFPSTVLF